MRFVLSLLMLAMTIPVLAQTKPAAKPTTKPKSDTCLGGLMGPSQKEKIYIQQVPVVPVAPLYAAPQVQVAPLQVVPQYVLPQVQIAPLQVPLQIQVAPQYVSPQITPQYVLPQQVTPLGGCQQSQSDLSAVLQQLLAGQQQLLNQQAVVMQRLGQQTPLQIQEAPITPLAPPSKDLEIKIEQQVPSPTPPMGPPVTPKTEEAPSGMAQQYTKKYTTAVYKPDSPGWKPKK